MITDCVEEREPESSAMVGLFYMEIEKAGLWPPSKMLQRSTSQDYLKRLRRFRWYRDRENCDTQGIPLDFEDTADFLESDLKGLCLKCVQGGKVAKEEGNCLQPIRSLCTG